MDDAIERCLAYVAAGADGIMIHSRKKDGLEILEFARQFRRQCPRVPLICVPTSYAHLSFDELEGAGFNAVIYANHMLRSAYMAMRDVAVGILEHGRTLEVEPRCWASRRSLIWCRAPVDRGRQRRSRAFLEDSGFIPVDCATEDMQE